jgi:hypothetical protein
VRGLFILFLVKHPGKEARENAVRVGGSTESSFTLFIVSLSLKRAF